MIGIWKKWLNSWVRWWNIQIKVNQTMVQEQMVGPVQIKYGQYFLLAQYFICCAVLAVWRIYFKHSRAKTFCANTARYVIFLRKLD